MVVEPVLVGSLGGQSLLPKEMGCFNWGGGGYKRSEWKVVYWKLIVADQSIEVCCQDKKNVPYPMCYIAARRD